MGSPASSRSRKLAQIWRSTGPGLYSFRSNTCHATSRSCLCSPGAVVGTLCQAGQARCGIAHPRTRAEHLPCLAQVTHLPCPTQILSWLTRRYGQKTLSSRPCCSIAYPETGCRTPAMPHFRSHTCRARPHTVTAHPDMMCIAPAVQARIASLLTQRHGPENPAMLATLQYH